MSCVLSLTKDIFNINYLFMFYYFFNSKKIQEFNPQLLVLISELISHSYGRNMPHSDKNSTISLLKIMCYYWKSFLPPRWKDVKNIYFQACFWHKEPLMSAQQVEIYYSMNLEENKQKKIV